LRVFGDFQADCVNLELRIADVGVLFGHFLANFDEQAIAELLNAGFVAGDHVFSVICPGMCESVLCDVLAGNLGYYF
jgi:hypothetical protein